MKPPYANSPKKAYWTVFLRVAFPHKILKNSGLEYYQIKTLQAVNLTPLLKVLSQSNTLYILLIFPKDQEHILKFYLTTWKDNALRLSQNVVHLVWVHH